MAEMSRRFNFDDFDEQIRDALDSYGEFADSLPDSLRVRRPGEIGGVALQLTFDLDQHPKLFDDDLEPTTD